jgi:superfamily II DNA/RNA helicase
MPPMQRHEQYIHRVGRVGRVGMENGQAIVFFDPQRRNDEELTEFLTGVNILNNLTR